MNLVATVSLLSFIIVLGGVFYFYLHSIFLPKDCVVGYRQGAVGF